MHQIELRNISLEYESTDSPVTALQDVSFSVEPSELLCVVGQSGCGKTTMLKIVAGFLEPTKGGIVISGKAVTGKGLDRGVVFQDFAQLFPWRTAQRNVEFGLEMKGISKEVRKEIALRFLRAREPREVCPILSARALRGNAACALPSPAPLHTIRRCC